MVPIATQTDAQRKAAAEKAAATRRRNQANRSRAAKKAAETRARAQQNRLRAAAAQVQRVGDTAVGAGLTAGERVVERVRSLREPGQELRRLQTQLDDRTRKIERRGARARTKMSREAKRRRDRALRAVRQTRGDVEQRADTARRDVERRAEDLQSKAQDLTQRVG